MPFNPLPRLPRHKGTSQNFDPDEPPKEKQYRPGIRKLKEPVAVRKKFD